MTDKNKNNSNEKKPVFDRQAFKDAIAFVESSDGKKLDNPNSSAAGRYHFLYKYIKNIPLLKGVSKREFINSPELQEKVMDMAIDGKLPGFKSYEKYSSNLKSKFNTTLRQDEIAALTHFLGAGGVKKFLSDPENYNVPGKNASIVQYLNRYNSVGDNKSDYKDTKSFFNVNKSNPKPTNNNLPVYNSVQDEVNLEVLKQSGLLRDERGLNTKVQDKTAVDSNYSKLEGLQQNTFSSQNGAQESINFTQQERLSQLAYGGDLNAIGDRDKLTEFNSGGSHEENPLGGIPQGIGSNGKMNTVEEGESKFTFDEGDYVFSDRITLDGTMMDSPISVNNSYDDGGYLNNKTNPITEPKNKKNEPPVEDTPKNLNNFIMDSDNKEIDNIYQNIHSNSNGSCLAGSLNCNTDYVAPALGVKPIRSLINNNEDKIAKYKINSRPIRGIGDYVPNQSIDAWEIHEFLRGENLGSDFYTANENTKYNKGIPEDLDYMSIPVGSIIGQGYSEGFYTSSKDGKDRNRHAMTVVGYDKKDGMPMVYDYGGLRRLDNLKALGSGNGKAQRITKITVPKGYEKFNRDYISSQNKIYSESLGFKEGEDFKINFNSKKDAVKAIENGVNEHAKSIALHYGVNKNVVEKLAKHLPGISYEETKLNNNEGTSFDSVLPTSITDSWIGNNILKPSGKALENVGTGFMNMFRDDDSDRKQDWEIEIEAYEKYPKDKEKFKEYFNKLKSENSGDKGYSKLTSSVGAFKIKDLSDYYKLKYKDKSNLYGANVSNKDELKNGSVAALSLLVEKYEKVKKMHPDLTDDQAIKLSVIGYSNASKMKSKDFVKNYIKNNNLKDNKYEDIISYKYE